MVIFAVGWALFRLWVGIAVMGLELILMGVALGMAKPTPPTESDEGM